MKETLTGASSRRELVSSGRRPASSDRSAVRAALFAERTEANVAAASTRVPPAVASDEIVTQSATASAPQQREPHGALVVVDVEVDEADRLPRPQRDPPVDDGHRAVRRHERRHDVGAPVTAAAVRMPPAVVGGEQLAERREEIFFG